MTVFSFFWQALAKRVFLKWGILVPIPQEQEMNDTPGNGPGNSSQLFSEQQPIITLFPCCKYCQRDPLAFGMLAGSTDGRLEKYRVNAAIKLTSCRCCSLGSHTLQTKRTESGKKREPSTPQWKQKLRESWQACLFWNDSQTMVNWESGQCWVETRGPGCTAQFLTSLHDMWK